MPAKRQEREHFRMFMRMQENFTGCRVLSYCIMADHFHILLEVPPMAVGGMADGELLKRLAAIQTEAFAAGVAEFAGKEKAPRLTPRPGQDAETRCHPTGPALPAA